MPDLYEATVPVSGRSEAERGRGISAAMRVVLVKLTGDRAAAGAPGSAGIVRAAAGMLQQYQYTDTGTGLELTASFDPPALDEALINAGLPLWSRERPSLLVWLAVDDGTRQSMVSRLDEAGYADTLRRRAALRGVPVMLPLLDATDAEQLQAAGGTASDNVLIASERYRADAVLIGAVRASPVGLWEGSWTLHAGETPQSWTSQGELPQIVIDEGIDGVADALAARYARAAGARQGAVLSLRVLELASVDDYARVQRYLESLSDVTSVIPGVVSSGQVIFEIAARVGAEALAESIALGDVLEGLGPQADPAGGTYRLRQR